MEIYQMISEFTNWVWGVPLTIFLALGGVILTIIIEGVQFRKMGWIFKNTLGPAFDKENAAKIKAEGGVSPLQTVIAAVGASVGTGNIVGVGTAIALGGPGALFWMWISAMFIMGMKYAENTLSCYYREKDGHGGYCAGPFMYMYKGLHHPVLANIFGILMLLCLCIICGMHAGSITTNLTAIGISKYISTIAMAVCIIGIAVGGMKFLVKITDKLVPIMGLVYIICGLVVIITNIGKIGYVFASIFSGAFTGTAAFGGFAGAGAMMAIRWGVARACYSNDAGLGFSACICAQPDDIGHPAKQGMWAVIEVFIDTVLICSTTAFIILFSGVWETGEGGATLAVSGVASVLGPAGRVLAIFCLVMFGFSSLIVDVEGVKIQAISMFKNLTIGNATVFLVLAVVVAACLADINSVFVFADFTNALILFLNVPAVIALYKPLKMLTHEWFDTDGHPENVKEKE